MTDAPVEIVAYDPSWPERFARERALLAEVLAPWLSGGVEHVGSTAVPRLGAKPVIDIMRRLAARHRSDREAYTDAETDFVAAVLADAGPRVGHGPARHGV